MTPRMLSKISNFPKEMHFIIGGKSWVPNSVGYDIQSEIKELKINCTVSIIESATHHLMCTNPLELNEIVNDIFDTIGTEL